MRIKILSVSVLVFFLSFCAPSPPKKNLILGSELPPEAKVIAQEVVSYEGKTLDNVWEGCMKTLIDLNFREYGTNRTAGRILAVKSMPRRTSHEFAEYKLQQEGREEEIVRKKDTGADHLYFFFLVAESEKGIALGCKVAGPSVQSGPAKTELKRFLEILRTRLSR